MASNTTNNLNLMQSSTYQDHKDLGVRGCAENLGIGYSTLTKWLKDFRESGIFLFVVLVIMHLTGRRKLPVSGVNGSIALKFAITSRHTG